MLQTKTRKLTCLRLRGVIIRESATESDSLVALSGIYAAKCAFGGTFYRAAGVAVAARTQPASQPASQSLPRGVLLQLSSQESSQATLQLESQLEVQPESQP